MGTKYNLKVSLVFNSLPLLNFFFTLQDVDGVHVVTFPKKNSNALMRAFSLLISNGKLSKFAEAVAFSGKQLAKNMLASECVNSYTKLLKNVLSFLSDVLLPGHFSQSQIDDWEWKSYRAADMRHIESGSASMKLSSVVHVLEENLSNQLGSENISNSETDNDVLTQLDWDDLREIERNEEIERLEMEEVLKSLQLLNLGSSSPTFYIMSLFTLYIIL